MDEPTFILTTTYPSTVSVSIYCSKGGISVINLSGYEIVYPTWDQVLKDACEPGGAFNFLNDEPDIY